MAHELNLNKAAQNLRLEKPVGKNTLKCLVDSTEESFHPA